jgi:UDP-N-acetylmuramate dehydrogenase
MSILRNELCDRLSENIPLARYTTARVGGPAIGLVTVDSTHDLIQLVNFLHTEKFKYKILGEGSNVLVSDTGFDGLVVINHTREIEYDLAADIPVVKADSGVNLVTLARKISEHGLSGFEWACGIPGSLGGAVYGNAGANGSDIQANLISADILQPGEDAETWTCNMFQYAYRSSVLKRELIPAVILKASLRMEKQDPEQIREKMALFNARRKETQPAGASLGSIFKNPPGDHAGRLIEVAGLKGKRIGGAEVSTKHANFILNGSRATALEIYQLIKLVQDEVNKQTGITLDTEIEFLGNFDLE